MTDGPPLVEVSALGFARGSRPILRDFDLRLAAGEHLLLLGPSGSGKTTLAHLIAGLLTPDAGRIRIAGEPMPADAAGRDTLRRRTMAMVFQTLRLIPALTLGANLALAARLAGRDGADIPAVVERLGLAALLGARPRTLSQGEAQRAAIARALVARPKLIIADEPTSALDDRNAARVADLLLDVAGAEGTSCLVVTHDRRLMDRFPRTLELAPPAPPC